MDGRQTDDSGNIDADSVAVSTSKNRVQYRPIINVRERKFQRMKVPRSKISTYGTFVPGNESSCVQKFQLPCHRILFSFVICIDGFNFLIFKRRSSCVLIVQ